MNKTPVAVITTSLILLASVLYCETGKKDVTDPVLQEIIASFSTRMPKFIDKHGSNIFVVDGPVNRGGLLYALYEYDKSLKLPKKDMVSRTEFDELKSRLLLIEKGAPLVSSQPQQGLPHKSDNNIAQIINELMPNMPVLLDNTLGSSKVFSNLKNEVNSRQMSNASLASDYSEVRQEVTDLRRRLDMVESRSPDEIPRSASSEGGISKKDYSSFATRLELEDIRKRISEVEKNGPGISKTAEEKNFPPEVASVLAKNRAEITRLSKRLEKLESAPAGDSGGSRASGQGMASLTKISLGLSMVAAFFVAR